MKKKICILTIIFILFFTGLAQGQGLNFNTELTRPKSHASMGGEDQRAAKSSMDSTDIQMEQNPPLNEVAFNVNAGMSEALKSINADTFRKQYGADGTGVKIAVIDTGIDISHPDLQKTPEGKVKVIDYIDFTDEGYVNTKISAIPVKNTVVIERQSYNVTGIPTRCGIFHLGTFEESQLDKNSPIGQDVNRNGKNDDVFGVLVTDSVLPGIYDTVYVDTNQNRDFSDEKPLKIYSRDHKWAAFGKDNPMTDYIEESSFVVTCIDINGSFAKLSFDGNGHGTHVAGIIGANGKLSGTAPGAQIIAIKAMGSSGDGNWEDIFKAIDYAGKQGADIINVSIGNLVSSKEGHRAQLRLLKNISLESNALVVIAAGNSGPGLATAYDTEGDENVITVGAYMSPGLWDISYNVPIPDETLWYYTGVGHGASRPTVVAPSSVVSAICRWDGGYFLMDGTSMASPFVSGSCALLLEQAKKEGLPVSARSLKKAIEAGARKIKGYLDIEQGSGLLDVLKSWSILKHSGKDLLQPPMISVSLLGKEESVEGITLRDQLKAQTKLLLANRSDSPQVIKLKSDQEWLSIDGNENQVVIPQDKPQSIMLSYKFPQRPGFYTARTIGYNTESQRPVIDFMTTAVVPYDLGETGIISINGELLPSRWERHFFKTVPGMSKLDITLSVLQKDKSKGRALIYIYDPDGQKVYEDVVGSDYILPKGSSYFNTLQPKPGVWEVVVASDYNLSDFGADTTVYQLNAKAQGIFADVKEMAFSAEKGEGYISREIMLKNGSNSFSGRLEGMGVAEKNEGIVFTKLQVKDGEFTKGPVVKVPKNAMSLKIDLIPPNNCKGDVDLYVYRKNTTTELYEEAAYSTKIDVLQESIYITRPEPGEYIVYIDGFSIPDGVAEFQVKTQVLRDKMDVYIQDIYGELEPNKEWKTRLHINVPSIGSEFIGYIAVKNENNEEISQIPLKLIVGKKPLTVEVLSEGYVTVRAKDTNNPIDTHILVNGIQYCVVGGKTVVPITAIDSIEIYDDRYAPLLWRKTY
jgi:subtilisin family serine protease